jgi:hypothetical protein
VLSRNLFPPVEEPLAWSRDARRRLEDIPF